MNEWTLLSLVVRFSDFRSDCEDVSCIYFAFPQDLDASVCHKPMPARQIPAARMTDVSCQLQYLFKMFTVCWYKAPEAVFQIADLFHLTSSPRMSSAIIGCEWTCKQLPRLQQSCSNQLSFTWTPLCGDVDSLCCLYGNILSRTYSHGALFAYIQIRAVHCSVASQPGWLLSRWTVYTEWHSLMALPLE